MEIFQTKWFQEDFQEDKKAATILSLVPGFIKARQSQLDRKPLLSISGFLWKGLYIDECSTRVVERDIYQWQTLPPPWSSPKVCQGLISTTICQAPNQQKFVLAIKFQISKRYWQTKYLPFLSLIFWGYSQNSNFILVVSF